MCCRSGSPGGKDGASAWGSACSRLTSPQQELAAFAVHQDMRPLDDNDVATAWLAEQVKVDQRRGIQVVGVGKQLFGEMGDRMASSSRSLTVSGHAAPSDHSQQAPAERRPHEPSGRNGVNPTESLDRRPECRLVDPPGEVNVTLQKKPCVALVAAATHATTP